MAIIRPMAAMISMARGVDVADEAEFEVFEGFAAGAALQLGVKLLGDLLGGSRRPAGAAQHVDPEAEVDAWGVGGHVGSVQQMWDVVQ